MWRSASLRILLLVSVCLATAVVAAGGARIDLNGEWRFRTAPREQGEREGWFRQPPGVTEIVRVPHSWNTADSRHEDYEGAAWYFREFEMPDGLRGKHVEINFGATFDRARVWLNGAEIGAHAGGYSAYSFDITPRLARTNLLVVRVDNRPTHQTIPGWALRLRSSENVWYDWWHYGGIVRDVWLSVDETAMIRRQHITARVEGVGRDGRPNTSPSANVIDRLYLENFSAQPRAVRLKLTATPEGDATAGNAVTTERRITIEPGAQEIEVPLRIERVRLWHFDRPQLYRLTVEMSDQRGEPLDRISDTFGARTIEIRDRKLYLNGEHVRLTGMTRHEESLTEGLAESAGTFRRDYDDMKSLHVTLTRPVHYQQHPQILDYCDRNGILIIPEIPVWQFDESQLKDLRVRNLAKQMMREMIEQDYNHPSIFAWSVANESATATEGGLGYFREMYEFVKSLDRTRFVTLADDSLPRVTDPEKNASYYADFVMYNQCFGSWAGPAERLPAALAKVGRDYPGKMVVISEFGLPGVFAENTAAADARRSSVIRDQLALLGKYDWIGGAILWCYQDYKSHRNLAPGLRSGYVDTGIMDEHRQRRLSYDLWRELNSPARVSLAWTYDDENKPIGFRAEVAPRPSSEIPSYPLRDYRLAWELSDADGKLVLDGEQAMNSDGAIERLAVPFPAPTTRNLKLTLRLMRPNGFVAARRTLDWLRVRTGGETIEDLRRRGVTLPVQ